MHFASDNWAAPVPEVARALAGLAGEGRAQAYGGDATSARAEALLSAFFGRDVTVAFTGTGTASNGIALAALGRPGGIAFCHVDAHVIADEANAPMFFAHGLKLQPVPGARGRMDPAALSEAIARHPPGDYRHGTPVAISLTQVTEVGTCHTLGEIAALTAIARARGLAVHMDGARFANALAFLDVSPADMTWRAGVDVVSLGFTKLGAWCAEAVVAFDDGLREEILVRRKIAGHEFSKMRFAAVQFVAMLEDHAWLRHARHANGMAARFVEAVEATGRARPAWPCQSNEVFLAMDVDLADRLVAAGARFYRWDAEGTVAEDQPVAGEAVYRFVMDHATNEAEIDGFAARLAAA